jgi:hypothetical protein
MDCSAIGKNKYDATVYKVYFSCTYVVLSVTQTGQPISRSGELFLSGD